MAPSLSGPGIPGHISQPMSRGISYLCMKLGGFTWSPGIALARGTILSMLSSIEVGTLLIADETRGEHYIFGQPLDDNSNREDKPAKGNELPCDDHGLQHKSLAAPRATLVVKSDSFWMRLFLFADMGFAEAYMLGEVACSDLTTFFRLFILNRDSLGDGTTRLSTITSAVAGFARSTNTLSNSLLNVLTHYDISNDIFAAFLSPDMTYSCPIWRTPAAADNSTGETLEEAQTTKLQRFIDGARIKPTDHVLEIGTGWGSFAIQAVKQTGCRVTTLTLSREQKAWAERSIVAEGLLGRIEVLLIDYRALPVPETPYDKIVSIEMLEAVGKEFLGTYFARINRLLKRNGGIAVFQCITMPEGRHEAYSRREDFVNHYIFPGGYLPSITQLLNHITVESKGTLIIEKVENVGGHYARTLRLWRERFLANFNEKIRPALMREHPDMREQAVEAFRKKWEYYFTYCEAGFLTKTLGDVIITVGREGTMELVEGIPL